MSAKILENDVHVFVVSWRTQEVLAYRDLKTNEVTVGDENKIQQVGYVAVLTRVEEELDNPETGGWKVIDVRFPFLSCSSSFSSPLLLYRFCAPRSY
jgi:import inner membrane translocase subunit TIM44